MAKLIKIKGAVIYWLIALLVYGALLAGGVNFEISSGLYHFALLLFPLALVLFKRESWASLGFIKGDVKSGLWLMLMVGFSLVGGVYLRAFLLDKSVKVVFDFSFLFVNAVILAPWSEEIFHRGLLQTKLAKLGGKGWSIILPAILFSLIHIPKLVFVSAYVSIATPLPFMNNIPVALFSFFIIGVLLGYIYETTRSVYFALIGHIIINFILLTFLY